MGLLTSTMRDAIKDGRAFFVFEMDIDGTTYRYGRHHTKSASLGFYESRVEHFGDIPREVQLRPGGLTESSVTVTLSDKDGAIASIVEGPAARMIYRSDARLKLVAEDVSADNFWTAYPGVIKKYPMSESYKWKFTVALDIRELRGLLKLPVISDYDFPNAGENAKGKYANAVYGTHEDSGVTTGCVTCPLVDTVNDKYLPSFGWIDDVTKIYSDGSSLVASPVFSATGANDWTYETINGRRYTLLTLSGEGLSGTEVITANCNGLTDDGDGSQGGGSGTLITNPIGQIEHALANFVFNAWETGAFYTSSSANTPLSADRLSLAAAYYDVRGTEGSRVVEGGKTGQALLDEFCTELEVPMFFTNGELAISADDHYVAATTMDWPWFTDTEHIVGNLSYDYDTSILVDEVTAKYMYSQADNKFFRTLRVKDPRPGWGVSEPLQQHWNKSSLT